MNVAHFKAGDKVVAGSSTMHVVRVEDMGIFFGQLLIGIDADTGKVTSAKGDTARHAEPGCEWCAPAETF
jgi:hypothetical protein